MLFGRWTFLFCLRSLLVPSKVGVSLNVNGTTFLFINAHLAAHDKRVQARMDNIAKIKVSHYGKGAEYNADNGILEGRAFVRELFGPR